MKNVPQTCGPISGKIYIECGLLQSFFIGEILYITEQILFLTTGCKSISPVFPRNLWVFPKRRNLHPVQSRNFKKIITDQQTCWTTWKIEFNFVCLRWGKFWISMNKQLPQFHIYLLTNVFPLFSNQSKCTAATGVTVFCSHWM